MTVQEYMDRSGIPVKAKGYEILKKMIELQIEDSGKYLENIMFHIACDNRMNNGAMYKSVQRAIQKGFPVMDKQLREKIFRDEENPTVSGYVRTASYYIRSGLI